MKALLDIQKKLVTNVTAWPLEGILWDLVLMRNVLLELRLVKPEDLKNKPVTHLQKLASLGKYF